jgi:hypothetical protein
MLMTDEEIRVAAAQKLADERRTLANNPETTPVEISPAIEAFSSSLGGEPLRKVPVIDDPNGRYGWCSDGVRLKVAADGGAPVYGWTIWEWPPGLLTAEFHCVWRSPGGELYDITPKPLRETDIVFVADPSYPANFDFDLRPRNRRVRSYEPGPREPALEALRASLVGSKRAYEEGRAAKAGLSLDAWLERKIPTDPLPEAIDGFIVLCAAFEEHFDTLGSSGFVRPDAKFIALAKQRATAQGRLRQLMLEALRSNRASVG